MGTPIHCRVQATIEDSIGIFEKVELELLCDSAVPLRMYLSKGIKSNMLWLQRGSSPELPQTIRSKTAVGSSSPVGKYPKKQSVCVRQICSPEVIARSAIGIKAENPYVNGGMMKTEIACVRCMLRMEYYSAIGRAPCIWGCSCLYCERCLHSPNCLHESVCM